MKQEDMSEGRSVRLVRNVDLFADGVIRSGLTGTVCGVMDDHSSAIRAHVKLDEYQPTLAPWDNILQVWDQDSDEGTDCTPDAFEPTD